MKRFALLLLVAPLALAACGGSSHGLKVDPSAYVRHAARVTASAATEHTTMSGSVAVAGMSIQIQGSGDFSNQTHVGSFNATVSLAGRGFQMNEVLDGTTIYLQSPLFAQPGLAPGTWVKLDLASFAKAKGIDYTSLMNRSPTQALEQLEAAGSVTQLGTESIDGVTTSHFRIENLDVSKLPQGTKLAALGDFKYGPIDVWIGNKTGYVYREALSFTVSTQGQSGTITMRTDYSKFGEAVHTVIPSPSETVDGTHGAIGGLGQ